MQGNTMFDRRDAERYETMTAMQRHALKLNNPEVFSQLRRAWCRANGFDEGKSRVRRAPANALYSRKYEEFTPSALALLKANEPATFEAMRQSWLQRGEPDRRPR